MASAPFINLLLASLAAAATVLWSPAGGGFSAARPEGWSEGPSPDEASFTLLGQGREPAFRPIMAVARAAEGDPDDYLRTAARLDKRPHKPAAATVAGRPAKRLRVSQTRGFRADEKGKGRKAVRLSLTREIVVIPADKGYWLLSYSAASSDFHAGLPAFEAILKSFSVK